MSTNKTTNYQLHKWEADDDFLRTEFNENFAAIDEALHGHIVVGSYTGNGAKNRHIDLSKRPLAVHIERSDGLRSNSEYGTFGGLALEGNGIKNYLTIDDTGFTLYTDNYNRLNDTNIKFHYVAFFTD